MVPEILYFLETFVYGHFADAADVFNVGFGYRQITVVGNEEYDSSRNGMRQVVGDQVFSFDFVCDEFGQHCQFLVDI